MAGAFAWILFVASSFNGFVTAQTVRNVYVNNQYIGTVHTSPLENGAGGRKRINIYFHPADNDLFNTINRYGLNWVQFVNTNSVLVGPTGGTTVDTPNNGYAGQPDEDNQPGYYTNNERAAGGSIWDTGNWHLVDTPGGNGQWANFESWLVNSSGNNYSRLVGLNWGSSYNSQGNFISGHGPQFINQSTFNLPNVLRNSGFGNWTETFFLVAGGGGPIVNLGGLILLLGGLLVAGMVFMRLQARPEES